MVVAESPAVHEALAALEAGARPEASAATAGLLRGLLAHDLLVDGDLLLGDLTQAPAHSAYGLATGEALRRRALGGVHIDGPADLVAHARQWLPAGLGRRPAVTLLLSLGPLARDRVDPLTAAAQPHLPLQTVEGRVELGPFVVPGHSACLRCVDAHRGEGDPRRGLVLEQYAAAGPRADGVPEPFDPPVLAAALAWAVRDCVAHLEGGHPATWSTTVAFGPGMVHEELTWARHPHCGCAWAELTG